MGDPERIGYETRLRAAVLAGDETAWRTWYDANCERLERYVRWRCSGLADLAADVLQETWLVAVNRIAAFEPKTGSFRTWLRGIAQNVLRNHLRREGRRNDFGHSAEPTTTDDNRAYRVAGALAELPRKYESVLRAKYLDGRSVCQIAKALTKSPKAIESLLTRARSAFKIAYEKLNDG